MDLPGDSRSDKKSYFHQVDCSRGPVTSEHSCHMRNLSAGTPGIKCLLLSLREAEITVIEVYSTPG